MNKENGEEMEVKVPRGQINLNTVLGAAGAASFLGVNANTAASLLKRNGNQPNVLVVNDDYSHRGGNHEHVHTCGQVVTQNELAYAQEVDRKDAEIARLRGEKYTDNHIIEAYKDTVARFKEADDKMAAILAKANEGLVEEMRKTSILETKVECMQREIDGKFRCLDQKLDYEINGVYRDIKSSTAALRKEIDCCCDRMRDAIALESERRENGDRSIECWVRATYVPGQLKMPLTSICPEPMRRYNSWTAPTEQAPDPASAQNQ